MLSSEQRGVLSGMIAALIVAIIGFIVVIFWNPMHLSQAEAPLEAIGALLKWDILLLIAVAGNIAIIARHRFFTPADIDGGGLTNGTERVRIFQATLQNTIEQTVLAFPIHLIWIVTMPRQWQSIVTLASMFFLIGRVFFWRGYASGAAARSFGFALTFYPSLLMLLLLCMHFLWS
jgi:hypothetical protein